MWQNMFLKSITYRMTDLEVDNMKISKITIVLIIILLIVVSISEISGIILGIRLNADALLGDNTSCYNGMLIDGGDHVHKYENHTVYNCALCGKEHSSNVGTPKLCTTCAFLTNRCKYCGNQKLPFGVKIDSIK